jgi:hypothetical protein
MSEQPWRLPVLALAISVFSAAISGYSALQARRAADAGDRMARANELLAKYAFEQARPRLVYSDVKVSPIPDYLFVRVQLRNSGNAPALVANALFDIPTGPCATHLEFPIVAGQVMYAGDTRGTSLCVRRKRKVEGATVDCATLDPRHFVFSVKYQMYGLDHTDIQESATKSNLRLSPPSGDPEPCP